MTLTNKSCIIKFASIILLMISIFLATYVSVQQFPLEVLESANVLTGIRFSLGQNPFDEFYPQDSNPYGVIFPFLVSVFSILEDHLVNARIITISCLVITAILFVSSSKNKSITMLSTAYWVAGSIFILNFLGTFPNQLGVTIYSLSLLLYQRNKSFQTLILVALLGPLAFYTKPYFVIASLVVISYHFFWVSKNQAIKSTVLSIGIYLATILLVDIYLPFFFHGTFFTLAHWTGFSYELLLNQSVKFCFYFAPLIWFAILAIKNNADNEQNYGFELYALCVITTIMLYLGGRGGAYDMSYHTQLLTPVLLLCIGSSANIFKSIKVEVFAISSVAIITLWFFYKLYIFSNEHFDKWNMQWSAVTMSLKAETCPYASVPMALKVANNKCADYESGTTGYYAETPSPQNGYNKSQAYYDDLSNKINDGYYSALYISDWPVGIYMPLRRGVSLEKHYEKTISFTIPSFYEELYSNNKYTGITLWRKK